MKQTNDTQTRTLQLSALKAVFASFLQLDLGAAPINVMLPVHEEPIVIDFVSWLMNHKRPELCVNVAYDVVNGVMHLHVDEGFGLVTYSRL